MLDAEDDRGLAAKRKHSQVYRLLVDHDLDVLAVQDTKVDGEEKTRGMVLRFAVRYYAIVLILLAALTSLTEFYNLQVTLTCLRHAALAMLYAAAFSCAARFFSLFAVKASVAKNFEVQYLLIELSDFTRLSRLFTCFSSLYHVGSCIMVCQKARREEYFAWYVQLPADVVRLQALTRAMVVSAALTFLTGPDIRALRRASLRLSLELWEARRRGDVPWWPKRGIPEGLAAMKPPMKQLVRNMEGREKKENTG
ncbi:hypothetical protein HPB51_023716 [Rhipicephalus microplus]|uniref:Uncharacterized protein n=1 Tax=Rhipicephalus microplus TaxID=6941 RepID=A0A9J6E4G1_RHIMP|nr:hypothetical protein HPB51_023716 [Rhipicephalus microplus]